MEIEDNVLIKVTDADIKYGTFIVPNYIKRICSFAFEDCNKLICVVIPGSVEDIGASAFKDCENLEKVNLSYGLVKIGSRAFYNCKNLKEITIPASVKCIENHAFDSYYYTHKIKLILETALISINFGCNRDIYPIKVGRTVINNIKKINCIREKEILTKIREKLKIKGINSKCYFKYKEHEVFIKMMLNNAFYIDFEHQLDEYIDEFIKIKGLKIEEREKTKKEEEIIYEKFGIKNTENFEYSNEASLQENQKRNATSFEVLSNSDMSNEIIVESNPIISQDSPIENIQQEGNINERLRKLSELPEKEIALIMDMAKNNIFDENIERYIDMSNEERLKILELESDSQQPYEVKLEKEPIEDYNARQKVKKI